MEKPKPGERPFRNFRLGSPANKFRQQKSVRARSSIGEPASPALPLPKHSARNTFKLFLRRKSQKLLENRIVGGGRAQARRRQLYLKLAGFRPFKSLGKNIPSLRISWSSNQISPPPHSGR